MKYSLKLRIFTYVLIGVILFVLASRLTIRYSASAPLITYQSELFGRQITRISNSDGNLPATEKLRKHLLFAIEGLKVDEFLVFTLQDTNSENFVGGLLAVEQKNANDWKPLEYQIENTNVSYLDVDINGDEWRLFKTQEAKTPSYWVALKKSVLRQRMFDILDVRDRMGLQIYPILILYIIFLTLAISYAALRPIRNMQQLFSKIDIKDTHSDAHLQTKNTYRELASFLNYFNELIDRSRLSYQQANRFSSDASHELKTPLTIIRGHLQRLINRSKDGSDDQIQLSLVMDEVERLISITNKLLMLSQADAGRLAIHKETIRLNDLVDHLIEDYANYRPDIEITKNLQRNMELVGDKDLITQLILNLFSNAFKYNFSGGKVLFNASCNSTHLTFNISNTTHLSAAGLDDRVFERFYRHLGSNHNQTNSQQGSGLGLSLCREIAIAHGGDLEIRRVVNQIVTFSCRLAIKGIQ
jgi:signal transduction histidine kinase